MLAEWSISLISVFFLKISRRYWHMHVFLKATLLQATPGWNWQKIKQMLSNTPRLNFCYLKIIRILHQRYHAKAIGHILKNKQKSKCVCIHHIIQLIIMKMKNRPPRYDINRPKPRYTTHKKSLKMLLICIKQHISNIWSSVHEKNKQHWYWGE